MSAGRKIWFDSWGAWDGKNTYMKIENSHAKLDLLDKLCRVNDSDIPRVVVICRNHDEADDYIFPLGKQLEAYDSPCMSRTEIQFFGLKILYTTYIDKRTGKCKKKKTGFDVKRSGEIVCGIGH